MKTKKELRKQLAIDHPEMSEIEVAGNLKRASDHIKTMQNKFDRNGNSVRSFLLLKNDDGTMNMYGSDGKVRLNIPLKPKDT